MGHNIHRQAAQYSEEIQITGRYLGIDDFELIKDRIRFLDEFYKIEYSEDHIFGNLNDELVEQFPGASTLRNALYNTFLDLETPCNSVVIISNNYCVAVV